MSFFFTWTNGNVEVGLPAGVYLVTSDGKYVTTNDGKYITQ
jgi:hypothetical protein